MKPPGIGVAYDHFLQHGVAGVVHQRLVSQCACQQIERLPRFQQTAFGQSRLIEAVALYQMLA